MHLIKKLFVAKKIFFLLLLMPLFAVAQTKPEVLTNKNIIDLHKVGLSDKIILSKIENSGAKFDMSTTAIIALKKEGISEDIIDKMISKSEAGNEVINKQTKTPETIKSSTATGIPEPESINTLYLLQNKKLIPLEKNTATLKTQTKMLGYGGASTVYEISGATSSVQIKQDSSLTFIVNTGGQPADIFVLYKVEIKKGNRQAVAATMSSFKGVKGSKGLVQLSTKMVKPGIYQISPNTSLEKGEYFFANKTVSITSSADVFAFSIPG